MYELLRTFKLLSYGATAKYVNLYNYLYSTTVY